MCVDWDRAFQAEAPSSSPTLRETVWCVPGAERPVSPGGHIISHLSTGHECVLPFMVKTRCHTLIDLLSSEKSRIQENLNSYQVTACDIMLQLLKGQKPLLGFLPSSSLWINICDECVERGIRFHQSWDQCYPL